MPCQRCSEPHHRGGCHRLATAASGGCRCAGDVPAPGETARHLPACMCCSPSYAGLPAPAHSTCMPHIVVFSMVASDHHGCLCLQGMVRRQGQRWARVCRLGQQTSPAQLNLGPGSVTLAASRMGLPRGDSTNQAGVLSRCCFSAYSRGLLHLHGATFSGTS